jgi:error-prone DNA polymerase
MSYVELHAHSAFSFLDGASSPAELAAAAAELGYPAIALTDHDGLWGSMEFAHACRGLGVHAITGAEVTVVDETDKPVPEMDRPAGPVTAATPQGLRCRQVLAHGGPSAAPPARGDGREFHLTLLVESPVGYRNLCRVLTESHRGTRPRPDREPLPPTVSLDFIERHSDGLVCLSGCARDGALAGRWERGRLREAETLGRRLAGVFGRERFRVELQRPFWRHDRARSRWLAGLAQRLGVACVATGNVHAHDRSRSQLQDALVAVRLRHPLDETEPERRGNATSVLAGGREMEARFAEHPDAVAESGELAARLRFDLTRDLGYRYPGADDRDADRTLAELCRARLEHRYEGMRERPEAQRRLDDELGLIRRLRLSGFFLLHYDLLELAREVAAEVRGPDSARSLLPPGRGRGSSVSSVVCFLTGLSHVDPVHAELFPGRFLNEEITDAPDIDLDFPRDIRERLIPRVHERYGPERSALVAAFATYQSRGAVRDLGKALGLPPGEIERVARMVSVYARAEEVERDIVEAIGRGRAGTGRWRALLRLAAEIWGLPRHASQHPGGMVLSTEPLIDVCPVQPAAMEGRRLVQWDKDSCADAGFLKIDLLGLGMLSAVERCVEEIGRVRGERIDLSRIPLDDAPTFSAIQSADTTGVFQIESRAQMQMLPRTLPENIDDITVQVALVRPGPIQGGAVHPYIERRRRLREDPGYRVPYEHPSLEPVLSDTLGAIVFQEQVLQVAMALAGFSAAEAEGLRRAMSRKRSEAALRAYRERFLEGAAERGVDAALAERVFEQILGFSGFGFPKAHAVAFGLLAYQSTWLRVHYGPEFLCSLLNEQPMGFYPPDALVHEAQRKGIEILGPDVNRSAVECVVEGLEGRGSSTSLATPRRIGSASPDDRARERAKRSADDPRPSSRDTHSPTQLAVRIGLGYVEGLREIDAEAVVGERERGGDYLEAGELASRSGIGRDGLERLAWASACDSLREGTSQASVAHRDTEAPSPFTRREALWELGAASGGRRVPAGTQLALPLEAPASPGLRPQTPWERLVADYASTGMTLGEHPMSLLRGELGERVLTSAELWRARDGSAVEAAGMVIARQRPATARGVTFMLLEDELGVVNVIVPPPVYERHRLDVRTAAFLIVRGNVERREGVQNLVAARLEVLSRPDLPAAEVRHIEPPPGRETGRDVKPYAEPSLADVGAVLPAAHSFGRRGG